MEKAILKVLPNLQSSVEEICTSLKNIGVEEIDDLKFVIESDLTPMVTTIQARKLIQAWKVLGR